MMILGVIVLTIALIVWFMFVKRMIVYLAAIFDQLDYMLKAATLNIKNYQDLAEDLYERTKEYYSSSNDSK